jgi:hypothetical protein
MHWSQRHGLQNMNYIDEVCAEVVILFPIINYVMLFLHHVEWLLSWHCRRTSIGVRSAIRCSSLLLGLFLLLLHQRTFQTGQVLQGLRLEMSWFR